jgi:hypothetical protein
MYSIARKSELEKALQSSDSSHEIGEVTRPSVKYQSDHNAVYGYFPKLIDGTYNVAIFTYNEKGNTCDKFEVNRFLDNCVGLGSADIIIAGIQEGDPGLAFIKGIRDYKGAKRGTEDGHEGVFTHSAGIKVGELAWAMTEAPDEMEWDDNAVLLGDGGGRVRQAVYKSFGKECRGKGSLLCLVNGIYVIIPEKSRLGAKGNNVPLIIQTGVKPVMTGYSKHMAWACIDTGRSQTVFFSCHLEYSGDAKHLESGYMFRDRANQLDGYLAELTAKFPGARAYICLGDTNMRTLYANPRDNYVYMIDQMMFYLLQVRPDDLEFYKRMMRDVTTATDFKELATSYPTQLYNKTGIDLFLARIAIFNDINKKNITNISNLTSYYYQDQTLDYKIQQIVTRILDGTGRSLPSKMKDMWKYATKDGIAEDPYAGYCLNPEFEINGTGVKYRAYDFTYKPIARATDDISELQDIYSYGPTAIFTLDLDARDGSRIFDAGKRDKSGGLLGPSHTDRILMFVPARNDKVRFINLA